MAKKKVLPKEKRSTFSNPDQQFMVALGGNNEAAGQLVNETTCFNLGVLFDGVRMIAEDIAGLDVCIYSETNDKRKKIKNHPLYPVLQYFPNENMSAHSWKETMIIHALIFGDAYSEIRRAENGSFVLELRDPRKVKKILRDGVLKYVVDNIELPQEKIFHLKGVSFDSYAGMPLVSLAKYTIGTGLSVNEFNGNYFKNGAIMTGFLSFPMAMEGQALKDLQEQFRLANQGVGNANGIMTLSGGGVFTPISNDNQKSQMIESIDSITIQVAQWLRIPPHMLASMKSSTNNNIEQQALEYTKYTLAPWAKRFEMEVKRKLFTESESSLFLELDFQSLLRTDDKTRTTYYKDMQSMGALTVNEIRGFENLAPVEDGDVLYVSNNVKPVEQVLNPIVPVAPTAPKTEEPQDEPQTEKESSTGEENSFQRSISDAHKGLLKDAVQRVYRFEQDKIERANKKNEKPDFNLNHAEHCKNIFKPVIESLKTCINGSFDIDKRLKDIVTEHIQHSKNNEFSEERANVFSNIVIDQLFLKESK